MWHQQMLHYVLDYIIFSSYFRLIPIQLLSGVNFINIFFYENIIFWFSTSKLECLSFF